MQGSHSKQGCNSPFNYLCRLSGILLLVITRTCQATVIDLHGELTINQPVKYSNDILNMTDGRFSINTGGTLEIDNSTINLQISADNPYFINMADGNLILKNNTVNITVNNIPPNANTKANYQLISIQHGNVELNTNSFKNENPFTVQFFESSNSRYNSINIKDNDIRNFHGGVYLINSHAAHINGNTFENVSNANIFNIGIANQISRNKFIFPGNLAVGNAIEVENSNNASIEDNIIMSAYNFGIYLSACQNISINHNKMSDGSSYAIFIDNPTTLSQINSNIAITNNYFSQNKFGITGKQVDYLTVSNNVFIQRFSNNKLRQYWTDNNILLPATTHLTWTDNLYKEAFTQEVPGNNNNTLQFVIFPQMGGVVLP